MTNLLKLLAAGAVVLMSGVVHADYGDEPGDNNNTNNPGYFQTVPNYPDRGDNSGGWNGGETNRGATQHVCYASDSHGYTIGAQGSNDLATLRKYAIIYCHQNSSAPQTCYNSGCN